MSGTVDDHAGRIEAAMLGALAGEAAAGTAAGAADLLGVAESVAATGGYDEADMRSRGLERPSRGGASGLLLRAVPFGLIAPLHRPLLRRAGHRCATLAGADDGTAVTAVAVAMLVADLMRFDLDTALLRVHQSLLEDAPSMLLEALRPRSAATDHDSFEPVAALRLAVAALEAGDCEVHRSVEQAAGGVPAAAVLAGALAGAASGSPAITSLDATALPHGERACQIARRLAERVSTPVSLTTSG